jgi:hypothetical protein
MKIKPDENDDEKDVSDQTPKGSACTAILGRTMIQFRRLASSIRVVETIAVSGRIREVKRLRRQHGGRRWVKVKGIAQVELLTGEIRLAEVHWYESHGVGRRELKIKRLLE